MTFGQSAGPPASAKQLAYLLSLVKKAGHEGFRDARGPLGLSQRQAGGKFTSREASELIDRLLAADDPDRDGQAPDLAAAGRASTAEQRLDDRRVELLRGMPAEALAAELERRGWTVTAP